MKKLLIAAVSLALGLGAGAAVEKVATVQVADKNTLVQTATTAGNLVGYPMLGMMATMGLADNPVNAMLGEFREGENALAILYADPDKVTTVDELDAAFSGFAFIYAPAKSKLDFLASQPGLEEKDGVIAVEDVYVAYAEDGKWAALAMSPESAKGALAEVSAVQKPMDGDFVRFEVLKPGVKIYSMVFVEAMKNMQSSGVKINTLPSVQALLDSLDGFDLGVRVVESGLDIRGKVQPTAGTDFSKICAKPLEGDAFAFAPADAVYASAGAEGSGCDFEKLVALYDGMVAAIKETGMNTDWYKSVSDGSVFKVMFDLAGAIKYFMSEEGQRTSDAVDSEEFSKKILALYNDDIYKINPASKAFSASVSMPGVESKLPMSALFAKTLPEASAKKPAAVCIYRYYAALKALAPTLATLVPENNASILKAGIATLPSDDGAAIASAFYREGDAIAFISHASAEEIRGFAAAVGAATAYSAMAEAENCLCTGDDDDSDDDDSDDDDSGDDAAADAE